tara:strand:- start:83 stop:613 length:531 start_codon:yes stop_codon:yes gene_type:complete
MSVVINKQNFQRIASANTAEYREGDWWINPIEPDCDRKYWKNDNGTLAEMTSAEKQQIDDAELIAAKIERKAEVQAELKEYIERAYSEDEQRDFLLLLWLASEQENQDAKNYIYPLIAWVQNGQTLMREAKQRIEAAADAESVEAAGYDYEAFYFWHQTMPGVTTQQAGEMLNGEN